MPDHEGQALLQPNATLAHALQRYRRRLLLNAVLIAMALGALGFGFWRLAGLEPALQWAAFSVPFLVSLAGFAWLRLRRVRMHAFIEHLNRRLPALEESAGLLAADSASAASAMQALQRQRALRAWMQGAPATDNWLPALRAWPCLLAITVGLAVGLLAPPFIRQVTVEGIATDSEPGPSAVRLDAIDIRIQPPPYTGLTESRSDSLDLLVPEGSRITWRLQFSQAGEYGLRAGTEQSVDFLASEAGWWETTLTADATTLYRLHERQANGTESPLEGVHTLAVSLDRAPVLRFTEPEAGVLEIPRAGPARFQARLEASDDFGLGAVEIRASLGRGSGEGVKFRDDTFTFDSSVFDGNSAVFTKNWDLSKIGMEPGDEMYFTAYASDNREPEARLARSETITVRWLDEQKAMATAEGVAIDVMPEYFKSQRQIIIETEQLITDRTELEVARFKELSQALALAQSDLKQRYGQYLGDEFAEDIAAVTSDSPSEPGSGEHADHQDADAGAHHEDTHAGTRQDSDDPLARFRHDHGEAEPVPTAATAPVGMMQKAIAAMWRAELELHMAQPEAALPFEYEALQYLDLARQADRIYTRRLGFEPPPVSEEKRLTGELKDVQSRERRVEALPAQSDATLFRALFQTLSQHPIHAALTATQRQLLQEAGERLTGLARTEPALIRLAATTQELLIAGRLELEDCRDCVAELQSAAWSLAGPAERAPQQGENPALDLPLARGWLESSPAQEALQTP